MNTKFLGQKYHQCNKGPQSISNVGLYFSRTEEPWVERMILTPGETDATSDHRKRVNKASDSFCSNLSISLSYFKYRLRPCVQRYEILGLLVFVWMNIEAFSKCHKTNFARNIISFWLHLAVILLLNLCPIPGSVTS